MLKPKRELLSFGKAFDTIKNEITKEEYSTGLRTYGMRLPHWNINTVIIIQNTDKHSKMSHPYLYVQSDKGLVPWIPTYPEMFSELWEVVVL